METVMFDGFENILANATTTATGTTRNTGGLYGATFQVTGTTTSGTGACVVEIQVSNDNIGWLVLSTVSLTLSTTVASDGFASAAPWLYTRAKVNSISGTGATVNVTMGIKLNT